MRLRRMYVLLLIGICIVGILASSRIEEGWNRWKAEIFPFGMVAVGNEKRWESLEQMRAEENPGVYFEGTLLPYDALNRRLYLPQNPNTELWDGRLTAFAEGEQCSLYVLKENLPKSKSEAIQNNRSIPIYMVTGKGYYEFSLVLTGMPLISMRTDRAEEAEEVEYEVDPDKKYFDSETRYYGSITVLNPNRGSDKYEILEAGVRYHYKGMSTSGFEKKAYSLKLLNAEEKKEEASLLGMQEHNSWKLNALNTDTSRIREITSSQIWEEIDKADSELAESGPNMEYVELVVDNEYKGIYCLVEPIDEVKLKLNPQDSLYKMIGFGAPSYEDIQYAIDRRWRIMSSVRLRYPDVIEDYELSWYPIQDYFETFYRGAEVEYETAVQKVNLDNFLDMFIFLMVTSASDNVYKNTYYVADGTAGGNYVMRQIPWDLDYTFGNQYAYEDFNHVQFDADYTHVYLEEGLAKLKDANPGEVGERLLERWEAYRATFLSTEELVRLLEGNRDYLLESGAAERETERWSGAGVNMDIEYILDFQRNRMEWLDTFFEEWASENETKS